MVVTHRQRVLFGKRVSAEDGFEWQLPGGWIEVGEPPQQAARREVLEETGLVLGELGFVGVTSNVFSEHKHSISLYFEAQCLRAESLQIREGDKCTSLGVEALAGGQPGPVFTATIVKKYGLSTVFRG